MTRQPEYQLRLFMRILGDKELGSYTDDEVTFWVETLLKLPARYGTLKEFRDIDDLGKVIEKNKTVKADTLARNTVQKKHIDTLKTFFNYAFDKKKIAHNPIDGHDIMTSSEKKKGTGRSFKPSELRTIFARENYDRYCTQPADWFVSLPPNFGYQDSLR
jgi:hypothetical protein